MFYKIGVATICILLNFFPQLKGQTNQLIDSAITSHSTFLQLANSQNNCYSYTVLSQSDKQFGNKVTVYVKNNIPVARKLESLVFKNDTLKVIETIVETTENLNSNPSIIVVAAPFTNLYNQCLNVWLKVNPTHNYLYFNVDENGILQTCGFAPKGCINECFVGVTISDFTFLPKGFFDKYNWIK